MSWQRIFELARRQKSPLIVTDIAGREPIVVLPLESYERMIDGQPISAPPISKVSPSLQEPVIVPVRSAESEPTATPAPARATTPTPHSAPLSKTEKESAKEVLLEEIMEAITEATNQNIESRLNNEVSTDGTGELMAEDILLEEKFYLEPLDDESK